MSQHHVAAALAQQLGDPPGQEVAALHGPSSAQDPVKLPLLRRGCAIQEAQQRRRLLLPHVAHERLQGGAALRLRVQVPARENHRGARNAGARALHCGFYFGAQGVVVRDGVHERRGRHAARDPRFDVCQRTPASRDE